MTKTNYRAKAEEWLDMAEHSDDPAARSAYATLANAYTQYAVLEYLEQRDSQPFDERRQLIEIGIELGKKARTDDGD